MNTSFPRTLPYRLRSLGFLAALFGFAPGLYASPVIFPGRSHNSVLAVYVAIAIFLEAICVAWLLRPFRRPRYFVLWILGTHLLTFPAFILVVWLLQPVFHDLTIALAEGLVVLAEGWLVCQICRRAPAPTHMISPPTLSECWYVTLIGSAISLLAFWLLLVPFSSVMA